MFLQRFETEGKCIVRGLTGVEQEWIPTLCKNRCTFTPLTGKDSEPTYDSESGRMMRRVHVTLKTWMLDDREMPFPDPNSPDSGDSVRYFARFLLDPTAGVCPKLTPLLEGGELLCTPSALVTVKHQSKKVTAFLDALEGKGVDSREKLGEAFKEDGDFLKEEFKALVPKYKHGQVDSVWPPL